ncbi:hypothetical protein F0919_01455 [Taibaiella lutea]|uniref:Uncharacterized protein n=1 Tax=Taibaiella lutea TaxID=2608001 RepID=A0A5M6CQY9_9BACT|nr:hypothetical protein [Taibaiella lutea]KAA5536362.1 hypothetical protein F0919_01455 [Taibaiella lutea]
MNNNIIAYIAYISITLYIIIWVGKMFHSNGHVFILKLFKGEVEATDTMNNILLIAYYLFNIGYAFLQLKMWEQIISLPQLIASLSEQIGILILILAVTHYFNMLLIYILSKKQHS